MCTLKGEYGCEDMGGIMKIINGYEGDHFNEITFKGGDRQNFIVVSPKSSDPPSQAINNERCSFEVPAISYPGVPSFPPAVPV